MNFCICVCWGCEYFSRSNLLLVILWFVGSSPTSGSLLTAQNLLPIFLHSLCPPPRLRALSKINNTLRKRKYFVRVHQLRLYSKKSKPVVSPAQEWASLLPEQFRSVEPLAIVFKFLWLGTFPPCKVYNFIKFSKESTTLQKRLRNTVLYCGVTRTRKDKILVCKGSLH